MGQEIGHSQFSQEEFDLFHKRLREETKLLMEMFRDGAFSQDFRMCGMELEAWLLDDKAKPTPANQEFLERMDDSLLAEELSKFNFELNCEPHRLQGGLLSHFQKCNEKLWAKCEKTATEMGIRPLMIGILPTLKDEMLSIDNLSDKNRYDALNREVLRLRKQMPLLVDIEGEEHLHMHHDDVMVEAAATSLQVHLQTAPEEAVRFYNASQIVSALTVAAGANSPFLFGKALWEETRIPTFEQAVSVASFRDVHGSTIGRVTFGTGYARESLLEPFLENLDGYPTLLPFTMDEKPEQLAHLRLHNGTIWRWNRPLIGFNDEGVPHLRIEHRVTSSGPTLRDVTANIALYLGLVTYLATQETAPETLLAFEKAKENFYAGARDGLKAQVHWLDGKIHSVKDLILELLPMASETLINEGLDRDEVDYYLGGLMRARVESGQHGSGWQRGFVEKNGKDFCGMVEAYLENQRTGQPVSEWSL